MSNPDQNPVPTGVDRTRLAALALSTAALVLAVMSAVWAAARCVSLARADAAPFEYLQAGILLAAGLAGALLLWALGHLLRLLESRAAATAVGGSHPDNNRTLYGHPLGPELTGRGVDELRAAVQELVVLSREIRDVVGLTDSERAARARVQSQMLLEQLETAIPALLQEHNWVEARRRVRQARERFPSLPQWERFEREIETHRAGVEARDVEQAAREVDELIALGAWERAQKVVRDLLERHPHAPQVQELVRRLARQREKIDADQRARLMAQAQEATRARDWNRALSLANEVVRRFPKSPEAEALRSQMATLLANAEIQVRHQMEEEFRELLRQHRFADALRLAHELIDRYPHSPQADVLREQLPKLEARAAAG